MDTNSMKETRVQELNRLFQGSSEVRRERHGTRKSRTENVPSSVGVEVRRKGLFITCRKESG